MINPETAAAFAAAALHLAMTSCRVTSHASGITPLLLTLPTSHDTLQCHKHSVALTLLLLLCLLLLLLLL
jgi:hypothetical protein